MDYATHDLVQICSQLPATSAKALAQFHPVDDATKHLIRGIKACKILDLDRGERPAALAELVAVWDDQNPTTFPPPALVIWISYSVVSFFEYEALRLAYDDVCTDRWVVQLLSEFKPTDASIPPSFPRLLPLRRRPVQMSRNRVVLSRTIGVDETLDE